MIHAYAALKPHGPLQSFEYDPGSLLSQEVEIKVHYCGICHSDLSVVDNSWGITQYPVVPGHEVAGVIAQVGSQVEHLKVGQKVGLGWHAGYCLHCQNCLSGDHNLCAQGQATIIGHHGGFADRVRAKASSVFPLPEGIELEWAGPLFCGGITVFNPLVQYNIQPTEKVAVIGIGGLGHLALQFLRAWGCEVTAFTSSEEKKREALKLGAHYALNSRDPKAIQKASGQFDFLLSTVNVTLDWNLYLETLRPKGRFHFVGAALEPLDIKAFSLISAQRSVSGSPVGSPATILKMLEFVERHKIKPIVEHFKMDQVNEALEKLRHGEVRYRIVLGR